MYTNRLILRFFRLPGINNLLIPGPPWAYVFDHLDQEPWKWTAADRKVAEEISSYWVNFAKSGNPNGSDLPTWLAFANVDGKVLYLGDPITIGGQLRKCADSIAYGLFCPEDDLSWTC
jgi:hypothetical protein